MQPADKSKNNTADPNAGDANTAHEKVLVRATVIFGTRGMAENWISSPCRSFDYNLPAEIIGDDIGLQIVMDYLERIELGVYQ